MSTKIAATFEATQRRLPWGFQKASRVEYLPMAQELAGGMARGPAHPALAVPPELTQRPSVSVPHSFSPRPTWGL